MTGKRRKWFRILGVCPCCGLRSNTDYQTKGSSGLSWEFFGHSVVNGYKGRLVNLIGPIHGPELPNAINTQIVLKMVEILAGASDDFQWLRDHIAERFDLGEFNLGGYVQAPELDRPVEAYQWKNPSPAELQKPVQAPPVRDVAQILSRVGPYAPTAPALSKKVQAAGHLELEVALGTPKETLAKMLDRLDGGRTRPGSGV